ncbi:MAG TPA: DUF1669 domain-containing protein [Bacteroidetes bacterium]|nr:DUF1669 domain-containing protein [Bacteroidota bacterium]
MNIIDGLAQEFQKTFEDKNLSKSERKRLSARIKALELDQRKRDILRAKIFDIARTGINEGEIAFTIDWLEGASRLLGESAGKATKSSRVYFSPGETCLNAITSQIQNARQHLDICVFTISDDRITNAILERHQRGIEVRIITDNDKLRDAGSDVRALAASGIEIRVDNTSSHMHHKFCIVDGDAVITGSYNWTRSAATRNQENILVTEEDLVVNRYGEGFRSLWEKSIPF